MKKLTKKSLGELAVSMPVISEDRQICLIGGGTDSCVFNCFDYLDGNMYTSSYYYGLTSGVLGYTPDNSGNVQTSDIPVIGSFGGFNVQELSGSTGVGIASGGLTVDGDRIMMVFNVGNQGHAVVATGTSRDSNGNILINYYDPTNNTYGIRANGDYSALYSVGVYNPDPSGSYNASGSNSGSYA